MPASGNHKNAPCSKDRWNVIAIKEFTLEDNALFAYLCHHCNYMQLSRENVLRHIQLQHQIDEADSNDYCSKYKLFQFTGASIRNSSKRTPSRLTGGMLNLRPKAFVRNDNIQMYFSSESNRGDCALCHSTTLKAYLVNHYVQHHPDSEVYISRISPENMQLCLAGVDRAVCANGKHKAFCLFCSHEHELIKSSWTHGRIFVLLRFVRPQVCQNARSCR